MEEKPSQTLYSDLTLDSRCTTCTKWLHQEERSITGAVPRWNASRSVENNFPLNWMETRTWTIRVAKEQENRYVDFYRSQSVKDIWCSPFPLLEVGWESDLVLHSGQTTNPCELDHNRPLARPLRPDWWTTGSGQTTGPRPYLGWLSLCWRSP